MSSSDARVFARALYETLISNVLEQLREAAPKLSGSADTATLQQRITAALPPAASTELRNFLAVLASEGALGQLPAIIAAFEEYALSSQQQTISADVTSAQALGAAQQERISTELRQRYGQQLELEFRVDPSIIGGLIIRVGDQVIDNSLRARLSVVQRSMMSS